MAELAVAALIAAATAAAEYTISYLFSPKPKPITRGQLTGDALAQKSDYGAMIPELYGWDHDGSGGGCRTGAQVLWTSGIRKVVSKSYQGGKGGHKQEVDDIQYYVDIALMWANRGPYKIKKIWADTDVIYDITGGSAATGVVNSGTANESSYNPLLPPDPTATDTNPVTRYNYTPTADSNGVITATLQGGALLWNYPGNKLQTVNSVIQADVDGRLGSGSTPAYRNRSYTVLQNFNISKYGRIPNFTALVEHTTVKTLDTLALALSKRVGIEPSTDLDVSTLSTINLRGLPLTDRYSPRQALENVSVAYQVGFCEYLGKIEGAALSTSSVVTLTEADIGWVDGDITNASDSSGDNLIAKIEHTLKDEIELPRRVDVRSIDPALQYRQNAQGAVRFANVRSENRETVDLPLVLSANEARKLSQLILEQKWIEFESSVFTLPYRFAYLKPLNVVTIIHDGITHTVRLGSMAGAIPGLLKVDAAAVDVAVLSQVIPGASGSGEVGGKVYVPSNTIWTGPIDIRLRDSDPAPGFYAGATPNNASLAWPGATLYADKGTGFQPVAGFTKPATMGRTVTGSTGVLASVADTTVQDNTNTVTIDLYAKQSLSSVTDTQMADGANACVIGGEMLCFGVATPVGGFPNRWTLSRLLRGRKSTLTTGHVSNDRFVLLNDAIKYIPLPVEDAGVARNYKCVTAGQDLGVAAPTSVTPTGGAITPNAPTSFVGTQVQQSVRWKWTAPTNVAPTLYRIYSDSGLTTKVWEGSSTEWLEYNASNTTATISRWIVAVKQMGASELKSAPATTSASYTTYVVGSGSGHTVQDEGTPLAAQPNLNIVGGYIAATNDAPNSATKVTLDDAGLRNRANHTGTQLSSTISDFNAAVDARIAVSPIHSPLTNGNAATPELVFFNGDVIMV